ncbi:MAG TPA: Fic family protein [Dongiaceae bacterium]|nr:Fic family protein [Dongiaceae bacterium]
MKMEEFSSGVFKQQYQYKSFSPTLVNQVWTWEEPKVNTLLEKATQALSGLNAYSLIVPNVDLFIRMHIMKEANKSSRIEGTQTEMDEDLMDVEQISPEKRDDWQEVQNYVQAMNHALVSLEKLPLSNRLLKETHAILLQGVRGNRKTPGDYRTSQNWIGGSSLQDAVFIPPHQGEVDELMADLEMFWHNDDIDVPHLIRIAISHYQFETIHPFLDGNGRIGRLLITLYLVSHGMLHKPSLYLSDYFEKNKGAYYDALTTVRSSNNLLHWIKFFLVAIIATAEKGQETFKSILALKNEVDGQIVLLGRKAENARNLLLHLYQSPLIKASSVSKMLDLTPRAANAIINDMVSLGILKEMTGFKRNRLFIFEKYMHLF